MLTKYKYLNLESSPMDCYNEMSIPVLMYHNVLRDPGKYHLGILAFKPEEFEMHLRYIRNAGYSTINLDDLYYWKLGERKLSPKSIIITFNDGFLDNLLYVEPLLQKYGFKGTIFVNPGFISPEGEIRTLRDVCENEFGYLNKAECVYLDQRGVLQIQSHTMTHDFLFTNEDIIDFYRPELRDKYYFLSWTERPDRWNWYTSDIDEEIGIGFPIANTDRALASTAFRFTDVFKHYFRRNIKLGQDYSPNELNSIAKQYTRETQQPIGNFESVNDFNKRSEWEIKDSKRLLEKWLDHEINHICWPGGVYNEKQVEKALNVGYLSYTVGSRFGGVNRRTDCRNQIHRTSITKNIGIAKYLG